MSDRSSPSPAPVETPPDPLTQNIETIRRLRAQAERRHGPLHRPVEQLFAALARPAALYLLVLFIGGWIGFNLAEPALLHHRSFDEPPFYVLDTILAVLSLLTTMIVLIVQARQGRLAEGRAELELQINLLAEQKIAKLIELVEGIRRDSPFLETRHDAQVTAMQESSDPEAIVQALEELQAE